MTGSLGLGNADFRRKPLIFAENRRLAFVPQVRPLKRGPALLEFCRSQKKQGLEGQGLRATRHGARRYSCRPLLLLLPAVAMADASLEQGKELAQEARTSSLSFTH